MIYFTSTSFISGTSPLLSFFPLPLTTNAVFRDRVAALGESKSQKNDPNDRDFRSRKATTLDKAVATISRRSIKKDRNKSEHCSMTAPSRRLGYGSRLNAIMKRTTGSRYVTGSLFVDPLFVSLLRDSSWTLGIYFIRSVIFITFEFIISINLKFTDMWNFYYFSVSFVKYI